MILWQKILVVDDSAVFRQMMQTILAPHCGMVMVASSAPEAIGLIRSQPDIELVLTDMVMKDGSGLDVVEAVAKIESPRPVVILVTAYTEPTVLERAREMGALATIAKPITIRKLLRAMGNSGRIGPQRRFHPRWRSTGQATLIDPACEDGHYVAWDIYNLSLEGAFLETKGPLPLGAEMDLQLTVEGRKARVRVRVARVQSPSWVDVGGVGVTFIKLDDDAEEILRMIAASEITGA